VKLRRRVVLDQILDHNGLRPFLFSLPDRVAQRSATKLVDFLVGAIGWEGLEAASHRRATLTDLGFDPIKLAALEQIAVGDVTGPTVPARMPEPIG